MRCTCGGILRVSNTFPAGPAARAATATCGQCARRATIVSFVAYLAPGDGQGACAVARKLAAGECVPCLAAPMPAEVTVTGGTDAPPA